MKKVVKKGNFLGHSFSSLRLVVMGSFLVIALALVVNSAQKSQDNRSSAASANKVIQDKKCTDRGGVCQKVTESCKTNDSMERAYVSGLCPSSDNTVKCCVTSVGDQSNQKTIKQESVTQDKSCYGLGGICQSKKGGCNNGKWIDNKCPSSDSKTIGCCVETDCNSSKCKCSSTEACWGVGCSWKDGFCSSKKVNPTPTPSGKANRSACTKDSECRSGKCAITDDKKTWACIPATGTVYVCDGTYSEKWVNGKVSGKGTKCGNGCKMSTGECIPGTKANRTACTKDSECRSGKCAITDSSKTRVCIPATGTVYVCDYYYADSYSEKWVDGGQKGKGTKCSKGCNISTGRCK